jgi:hypothetical protein
MSPTPPSKRHHLPFMTLRASSNSSKSSGSGLTGNKLTQLFVATCIASFCLQLLGSLVSWRNSQVAVQRMIKSPLTVEGMSHRRTLGLPEQQQQQSSSPTSEEKMAPEQMTPPRHSGRLRVLVGILTADFFNDSVYRKRHRALFALWNDPRVCSLPDFKSMPLQERYRCEFIYTFVVGANPEASPELVDGSRPMEVTRPVAGAKSADINNADMTLLNIRENMNEGKSQTWLHYGATVAEEYDLDYVVKCDADAIFHLHEFFHFAYKNMPPAPYNTAVYIGALRDKAYWPRHKTEEERIRYESFFGNNYEGVHLYVAGQIYILSTDLAKFIGKEALKSKCSYCEGHEDHDISAMAFHYTEPIKLTVVGRSHRFWEHPVKGEPRWKRIWARENARMTNQPFEGKFFSKNSTLQDVLQQQR